MYFAVYSHKHIAVNKFHLLLMHSFRLRSPDHQHSTVMTVLLGTSHFMIYRMHLLFTPYSSAENIYSSHQVSSKSRSSAKSIYSLPGFTRHILLTRAPILHDRCHADPILRPKNTSFSYYFSPKSLILSLQILFTHHILL